MRMDKFTTLFQTALADAQSLAVSRDQQFIEPVHLMRAMLSQEQGSVKALLIRAGVRFRLYKNNLRMPSLGCPRYRERRARCIPPKN